MKVYLVTRGQYDYYHVKGIFSSQEKAQAYLDANKDLWAKEFCECNDIINVWEVDCEDGEEER